MVEEFGVEEFGASDESAAPTEDVGTLKQVIADLTKQAAETMDASARDAIRTAKREAEIRLAELLKQSGITEQQWLQLSKAYLEAHGNPDAFKNRLTELGGVSNEAYYSLTNELSKHHADKKEPTGKKRGRKPKETTPPVQSNTPEERWPHIIAHASNLGMDANLIHDELGYTALSHESVSHVLREVNERANPKASAETEDASASVTSDEVEEFGSGEESSAGSIVSVIIAESAAPSSDTSTKPAPQSTPAIASGAESGGAKANNSIIWDDQLKKAIEIDTGEVVTVSWFLEQLGIAQLPERPDKELCAKILDVMHTYYLDRAARYREQAEKLAVPLDKRAQQWEAFFGPYLDACGDAFLPRKGQRAKDPGSFSNKTLDLITGSISWRKEGGVMQTNSAEHYVWLGKKLDEMKELVGRCQEGDETAKEELKYLQDTFGLRIETKAVCDNDKIKALEPKLLPPGWEKLEVNEFAKRIIK